MSTPNIDEIMMQVANLSKGKSSGDGNGERPEYKVALYINVVVLGQLKSSIRIFKDPTGQKGMSKQQIELHKALSQVDPVKLEKALQSQESGLITVESVKSGDGNVDTDSVESFADQLKALL